jgi:lipoyl-dependent peroxiredoxin
LQLTTRKRKESAISHINNVLYTAKTHTRGGRDGAAHSSDGHLEVKLSTPGKTASGTNPEQLFSAGWSACFLSALDLVASKRKLALPAERAIDAEVDLGTNEAGFILRARLNVGLPGIDRAVARALVDAAHQTCPYSKATHDNIDGELNVI